jgi:nitrate reductase gamma subunit
MASITAASSPSPILPVKEESMHDIYSFVSGPMVWIAFVVFIVGSLYKIINLLVLVNKKEKFIFSYMSLKYSLRSIFHWMTPYATLNMRLHPVFTFVTFAFHVCLLIAPLFVMAHVILVDESWQISWPALPDGVADVMTLVVLAGCLFFLIRRLLLPEVQFVTSISDYVILAVVAAPFLSGFLAYHQIFDYRAMLILHIVCGEIMLMAIPFTRLSHMILAPFTRAYMGSEFGAIRNAKDY